jgi:hypothetical protein
VNACPERAKRVEGLGDRPRAAEFLNQRADVGRFLELHDLSAPKRKDVNPAEIDHSAASLRSFTARPKDHDLVPLGQELCGPEILEIEGVQQKQ